MPSLPSARSLLDRQGRVGRRFFKDQEDPPLSALRPAAKTLLNCGVGKRPYLFAKATVFESLVAFIAFPSGSDRPLALQSIKPFAERRPKVFTGKEQASTVAPVKG
jgi:hypothetical protein